MSENLEPTGQAGQALSAADVSTTGEKVASGYYIRGGSSYFKFKSGVEVRLKPVSPALLLEIQRSKPKPKPPIVSIPTGDGTFTQEVNEADPNYIEAVSEWSYQVDESFNRLLLKLGVDVKVDVKEVQRVRDFMREEFAVELDKNDQFAYLRYCLPGDDAEYSSFIRAVMGRGQPGEGAVAQAIENF